MAACSLIEPFSALLLLAQGSAAPDTAAVPAAAESLAVRATVFATAAQIPSPVAFSIDDHGVVYTADSFRFGGRGHFDVRAWRGILPDDWRLTSVAERRTATERWARTGLLDRPGAPVTLAGLSRYSEQVRRLIDRDGDGVADTVAVFAAGMNELERGAMAGVLAWGPQVYATAIPELLAWRDSSGTARGRRVLQAGFGVHMGQGGHDMHGLTMGLDGRLYWSIGDRGFALTTRDGKRFAAHEGAVFRCWPDGSGLELYARGLRNPQELAFDDHGDLFTADNNADVGDRSRWLYVPEGANGGWEYFLQFTPSCGTWLREHEWEPAFASGDPAQPAWVLHPVGEAGSCPAGLAAYPGTGLPPRYDGTLWLADFVGGVDAWRFAPQGAGFKLMQKLPGYHRSWGTCDVDFAPDGRLFVLYWGESWQPNEHARLMSLTPAWRLAGADSVATTAGGFADRRDAQQALAEVTDTRGLLATGMGGLDDARLATLLSHPDRRLRQRASLELGRRGRVDALARVLDTATEPRARLHALWGLNLAAHGGMGARVRERFVAALAHADPEVRRLAATLLGEMRATESVPTLSRLLADPSPRVRFAAGQALARVGDARAVPPLVRALAANGDSDTFLRFAYARALARAADTTALAALDSSGNRSVRLGAVLALREARSERVSTYLADADPQVATEAARAAYDLFLPRAMHALALMLPAPARALRTEPWLRRALHAALRDGSPEAARGVAEFAADDATPAAWKEEALRTLVAWDAPDPRDGVWGRWAPLPPRPPGQAHAAIERVMARLLDGSDGDALLLAVELANREHVRVGNATFLRWVRDETIDDALRLSAFGWLSARAAPELAAAEEAALASRSDSLFSMALAGVLARDPARGVATVEKTLASGRATLSVRQAAVRALAGSTSPEAMACLRTRWRALERGTLDSALILDVTETAARASDAEMQRAAEARLGAIQAPDSLARWAALLRGGDGSRGRRVFEDERAACLRCHALDGRGGGTGPDLSLIGTHSRGYLVESLVAPAARLAPGYTATTMPPMGEVLSADELRDVVEFLAGRRDVPPDVPLGGLKAEVAETGMGCVAVDRACSGSGLRVAARDVARGVGVVSPSRLLYPIPAGSVAFVGLVGLDDSGRGGQVEFRVKVDGRLAWRSGPVRMGRQVRLSVPLAADAARLELIVDDGGTAGGTAADWLQAGFVKGM